MSRRAGNRREPTTPHEAFTLSVDQRQEENAHIGNANSGRSRVLHVTKHAVLPNSVMQKVAKPGNRILGLQLFNSSIWHKDASPYKISQISTGKSRSRACG